MSEIQRVADAIIASRNLPPGCEINWDGFRRDAKAAIDAISGWRPIETAPKDGSEIILGVADRRGGWSGAGFYHDGSQCKRSDGGWFSEDDRNNLLIARDIDATHWQPIPAPPKIEEAA